MNKTPSVKTVVDDIIARWPLLFKSNTYEESRLKALSHLFLTAGNDYLWSNGRPIPTDQSGDYEYKTIPENFFKNAQPKPFKPYPAFVFHGLPENIATEWLDAAEEVVLRALDYYSDFDQYKDQFYIRPCLVRGRYKHAYMVVDGQQRELLKMLRCIRKIQKERQQ